MRSLGICYTTATINIEVFFPLQFFHTFFYFKKLVFNVSLTHEAFLEGSTLTARFKWSGLLLWWKIIIFTFIVYMKRNSKSDAFMATKQYVFVIMFLYQYWELQQRKGIMLTPPPQLSQETENSHHHLLHAIPTALGKLRYFCSILSGAFKLSIISNVIEL